MFDALAGLDDETAVVISTEKQVIATGAPQRSRAGGPALGGSWDDEVDDVDDDVAMEVEVDSSADADLASLRLTEIETLLNAN